MIAAHADWSIDPRKRWIALARRGADGWRAEAPRLVGDTAVLLPGLMAEGAPVALGLDLPLGVPRGWAAQRSERDFPAMLRGLAGDADFFSVSATLAEVSPARPFYPARGVKGMTRAAHAAALGLASARDLSRLCDRATATRPAGAPVFWTLGANQSGKAAIAAWRDWLAPALAAGAPVSLWPFEGGLHGLLAPGRVAVAEVYPAEALRQLGLKLSGSKRAQAPRIALAETLRAAMARLRVYASRDLARMIADGFGADAAGEDRLDCVLGLLALIAVLDGAREDVVPEDPWIRRWEGWVLGQSDMPREDS
ncbi:hypothetical protein DFH01_27005 [Falsiroseomonas bella]|uniref:DUF429 domain-containing protein n=1 Tax=Falsiroseomonas bella TaxID=2184016 RepID=A0A317F498_9PROT|nr:hypothetical protein [Falsiroseomonas bella]PWS33990.1 hypothetical protein DFH01_27005 [Falsiroseomonas bella]